ncbi:MAG: class I SAM-dependent methyltransferase [Bryobacteraceae bacterium]
MEVQGGPSLVGSTPPTRDAEGLTARHLSRIARTMYTSGPFLLRKLQHWRPYICPFERLVGHVRDGSRVLDIGCGSGLLLSLAAGTGAQFHGVGFDVSRQGIDLATRMTGRAAQLAPKAKLSFQRLNVEEAWPKGEFDIVFVVDVLHHIPPKIHRPFLGQVMSKVKPGGTLVYKDMCLRPWWMAQANRLQDLVVAREWIQYAPIQSVESWAADGGMRVVVREDLSRLWCGHELRVMIKEGAPSA